MKNYIERYVYDVVRRLPEKNREEVKKELRANIQDMLSDNPTEEEIKSVLTELGAPRKLATNYREKPRYLISPEFMDDYLYVLKLVLIIAPTITFVISVINAIVNPDSAANFQALTQTISTIIADTAQSIMFTFALITFIFAMIDHSKKQGRGKDWNPDYLPQIPKSTDLNIPQRKAIASTIITFIFSFIIVVILVKNATYFIWYDVDGQWIKSEPVFSSNIVNMFLPFIITSFLITFIKQLIRLKELSWNMRVAVFTTISSVIALVVFIVFINYNGLINNAFIIQTSDHLNISADALLDGIKTSIRVVSVLAGLGTGVELIQTWLKVLKKR